MGAPDGQSYAYLHRLQRGERQLRSRPGSRWSQRLRAHRHLQAEARLLAREQIEALENALLQIERLSCEIADGGEAYPVGVREVAGRLAEDCKSHGATIHLLAGRA